MTTVAYKDGIVAADSQTHSGGWKSPSPSSKLERVGDVLYARIGDWAACAALRKWIDDPQGAQPGGDCTVVVFRADGVTVYSEGGAFIEDAVFRAWGSGAPVALGAMHAGCTAEEAVKIAALVDPYTGGPVTWMLVPGWADQ